MKRRSWDSWLTDSGAAPQTVVCQILGSTRKTVLEWEAAGMPRNKDGSYSVSAVVAWVKAHYEEKALTAGKDSPALEEFRRAKADLARMDLAQRRGELIPTALVASEWGRLTAGLKETLLGIPSRMGPRLVNQPNARAISAELDEAIRRAINDCRTKYVSGAPVGKKGRKGK